MSAESSRGAMKKEKLTILSRLVPFKQTSNSEIETHVSPHRDIE